MKTIYALNSQHQNGDLLFADGQNLKSLFNHLFIYLKRKHASRVEEATTVSDACRPPNT
jgi:cell wall-associated NlpC family hydrolase